MKISQITLIIMILSTVGFAHAEEKKERFECGFEIVTSFDSFIWYVEPLVGGYFRYYLPLNRRVTPFISIGTNVMTGGDIPLFPYIECGAFRPTRRERWAQSLALRCSFVSELNPMEEAYLHTNNYEGTELSLRVAPFIRITRKKNHLSFCSPSMLLITKHGERKERHMVRPSVDLIKYGVRF